MGRDVGDPRARWAGPLAIAICGVAMAAWTWGTWPDIVIDSGRELYVPWRITEGAVLYRDVAYFNGPLSAHLNALLFALFGVSLRTLALANLGVLAGLTAMLYTVLAAVSGRLAATAACLTFLTVFAFSQYNWTGNANYICPYSHEVTHGMTLAVGSVAALLAYLRRGRTAWAAVSGLALGLAFLTKAELFVAALLAVAAGWPLAWWTARRDPAAGHRGDRRAGPAAAALVAGALLPPLVALGALCARLPPASAARGVAGSWKWLTNSDIALMPFFQVMAGWADPRASLARMLAWTGVYLLILGPAVLIALAWRGGPPRPWVPLAVFAAVAGGLAWISFPRGTGEAVALAVVNNPAWSNFLRPLPVLLLATAMASLYVLVRPRAETASASAARASMDPASDPALTLRQRAVLTLSLTMWAGALLLKMLLNAHVEGYGFAHAMPATLLAVTALGGWIPELVAARGGRGEIVRAVGLALVAVAAAAHLRIAGYWIGAKSHAVAGGGDAFYADDRAAVVNDALDYLRTLRPGQTFVVFPEGIMLNYLARRPTATPYVNFIPPELMIFGQAAVFDALQRASPDYVVIVQRPTREYGPARFGRDYAQDIYAWIAGHYDQVQVLGANPLRDPRFGILLARRRAR